MTTIAEEPAVKCGQKTCDEAAVVKIYWPGREPMPSCERHKAQALGIAGAMGFHLAVEPICGCDALLGACRQHSSITPTGASSSRPQTEGDPQ